MIKILIYELDFYWQDHLKSLPYNLTFVYSENEVYEVTYKQKFDFYIFDFENGYKVLESLRESDDNTLCVFLSNIETIQAQKKAYKIGDDFFKKSITYIEEIKIKLDYYIKKYFHFNDVIKYNDIYFYTKLHQLYKDGKKIELTALESELLILFLKNKNRYLSKDYLIDELDITEGSLKVKLSYLRKLGFDIINNRELGYQIKE